MQIGVPRERKTLEQRVAITPDGARELIKHGHSLIIETNAGLGSSFPDDAYKAVGCRIVKTLRDVWTNAELLVKVKEQRRKSSNSSALISCCSISYTSQAYLKWQTPSSRVR